MRIVEYRIILPLTLEEYQRGQLWSIATLSKEETGGGEGIEVLVNEPFDAVNCPPESPLRGGDERFQSGQFTHKRYHLKHKVPKFVRIVAPKGSLDLDERSWNAYPYCKTVIDNPDYMKEGFFIDISSMHIEDKGKEENAHLLSDERLSKREVVTIDIAGDPYSPKSDYDAKTDPLIFRSTVADRGPLSGSRWWETYDGPVMCAYKLLLCKFKWFGLQARIESLIVNQERRIFTVFHRRVFCWMDQWYGLTVAEVREYEEKVKHELDNQINRGTLKGLKAVE